MLKQPPNSWCSNSSLEGSEKAEVSHELQGNKKQCCELSATAMRLEKPVPVHIESTRQLLGTVCSFLCLWSLPFFFLCNALPFWRFCVFYTGSEAYEEVLQGGVLWLAAGRGCGTDVPGKRLGWTSVKGLAGMWETQRDAQDGLFCINSCFSIWCPFLFQMDVSTAYAFTMSAFYLNHIS